MSWLKMIDELSEIMVIN